MQVIFVFLITLGTGQLLSTLWRLRAISLVGGQRWLGFGLGLGLIVVGLIGLGGARPGWGALGWLALTVPLTLIVLAGAGSFIQPPLHPDGFFAPDHPAHGSIRHVMIPDGDFTIPALLVTPLPEKQTGAAVCMAHGSGDHKTGFKWRLVQALLAEGLTVLTIDLPGHGEYQQRPLSLPDCLTTIPAAVRFLRAQPGVERVGVLGISLGAALALRSLVDETAANGVTIEALALMEMPLEFHYNQALIRHEMRQMLTAPVLDLFQEITVRQLRQSWGTPVVRSRHSTEDTFALLDPRQAIRRLAPALPLLLVYSHSDPIAPADFGNELKAAAPQATLILDQRASHVTMILVRRITRQVAQWLRRALT